METLRDICLLLVLIGIAVEAYLFHEFWWLVLFPIGATVVLLIIKYVFRKRDR